MMTMVDNDDDNYIGAIEQKEAGSRQVVTKQAGTKAAGRHQHIMQAATYQTDDDAAGRRAVIR